MMNNQLTFDKITKCYSYIYNKDSNGCVIFFSKKLSKYKSVSTGNVFIIYSRSFYLVFNNRTIKSKSKKGSIIRNKKYLLM